VRILGWLNIGVTNMKIRFSLFAGLWFLSSCLGPASSAQSVKPGTEIQVQLLSRLDTGNAQAGQDFLATLAQPVSSVGKTVWSKGTAVKGRVVEVVSSGRLQRPASITLQLIQIGNSPIETEPEQIGGKSHAGRNVALIGGGAAAGAILGGIAGGGKGAVIGTAVGAGAGTATAAATGKQEIVLPPETPLTFAVAGNAAKEPQAVEPVYRSEANSRPEPVYQSTASREYDHPDRFRLYFSERQQDIIRAYFRSGDRGRGLPPGLAKRNGDLPPGLEKQVRRNGTLPPGLQRRVEPFPVDLDRRLEPLPAGYSRVILSGRALIMKDGAQILDVMFIYE
jgi:hypothetical protein